ncbi:MAG: hypothetical protein AABW47_04585 [Nanoarchaeota archaeon]
MTIQKRFKDKKRQEVWLAGMTGGTQHYLDELTPRGKVSLWKKIRTISIIILFILIFLFLLYLQYKYN